MFIIKKQVGQNTYYWNDKFHRWEGLEENATPVNNDRFDILMGGLLLRWNAKDYTFFKVASNPYRHDN